MYNVQAVGEPPLFLAASVFFAIRDAIQAARKDSGLAQETFHMDSPATCERIRMACSDHLIKQVSLLLQHSLLIMVCGVQVVESSSADSSKRWNLEV